MRQHLKETYEAPKPLGRKGPLYVGLVDFEKAFDSVPRDFIWLRLEERGVHGVFLQAIKAMFHVAKQKVKVNGNLEEEFNTFLGVKQGDPLSTDLFGILMEVLHDMLVVLGARGHRSADRIQQDPRSHVCRRHKPTV